MRKISSSKLTKLLIQTFASLLVMISAFGQHFDPPEFTISCPTQVQTAGETVELSISTKDKYWAERLPTLTFNWTVSIGTILEGQGTLKIKIQTPKDAASITATVQIESTEPISYREVRDSCTFELVPTPVATKFDEFSIKANCEDILARLDNYFINFQNDPTVSGLIAIYDKKESKAVANANSIRTPIFQILTWMEMRRFDSSRINIIRAAGGENAKTEFWIVPLGATPPEIYGVSWSYDLSARTKAFLLGTEFSDGIGGCDPGNPYLYAEFLKANPKMRGNIVIRASSAANYRHTAKETLDELVEKRVSRGRLKTFFVKVKPNFQQESTEFWLVPVSR